MPFSTEILARNVEEWAQRRELSLQALAERARIGRTTLTRLSRGENISIDIASRLADVLRVPLWRLFAKPGEVPQDDNEPPPGFVRIPRLDIHASAGDGATPLDQPDVLDHLDIQSSWLKQALGVSSADNIRIIGVKGDSMSPTLNHGDVAFVDTAERSFDGEGIYVLVWQERLLIKRLRVASDNRLAIHSDNTTAYPPEYIGADQADHINICGRVVRWWSLRRY